MTPSDRDQCCCKVTDPRDCFVARHPEARARFDDSPLNRPWDCEICECGCHHGEADDEFDDDTSCYHCGGKRYVITCPDDLCATSDSCMHGDGEEDCPVCNADGDYEWNC